MANEKLIESWLPLDKTNFDGDIETAFKFPPKNAKERFKRVYGYEPRAISTVGPRPRNLHLWLARRPCGVARVLTLAAILRNDISKTDFEKIVGFDKSPSLIEKKFPPLIFYVDPNRELLEKILEKSFGKKPEDIVVVDPMAGGGSIPLEALRLGFRTIAIEYNPVAYIILKATLEYPAKYGKKLYKDVKEEAQKLIEFAKEELMKYYTQDAYNYIFGKGYFCPKCGKLNPIIHTTKISDKGPFIQFKTDGKEFKVEIIENETSFDKLKCIHCKERLFTSEEVIRNWIKRHKELLKICLSGDIEKAKKAREELLSTHVLLVKQTSNGFVPCDENDRKNFFKAFLDLTQQIRELKPFIHISPIPSENDVFKPIRNYGIEYWYQLFNPRQLLTLAKLMKYTHDRVETLIKEKGEYGAAIGVYLALGIDKLTDYNNIATMWHTIRGQINRLGDQYASKKSIGLGLDYCEMVIPLENKSLGWAFEPYTDKLTATKGGVCPILNVLCNSLEGLGDRIEVYMADARELTNILKEKSVDLVNVDPPYYEQHNYGDLSEIFWQNLRIMLKPAINNGFLFNRDKEKGKIECFVKGWNPGLPTIPREGEIIVRKSKNNNKYHTENWFEEQMFKFFSEVFKILKEDGSLIVWYTHSNPKAWEAIIGALYAADFVIGRVWNIRTDPERFIGRIGGSAFLTSLALVATKSEEKVIVGETSLKHLEDENVRRVIVQSATDAINCANVSGANEKETYIMAIAGGIAGATKIHNPSIERVIDDDLRSTLDAYIPLDNQMKEKIIKTKFKRMKMFFKEILYPISLFIATNEVLKRKIEKMGFAPKEVELLLKTDNLSIAYLLFWLATRFARESKIDYDFAEKICKVTGIKIENLKVYGLLVKSNSLYLVPCGNEIFDIVSNRLEVLNRTNVGKAMMLINHIVDSPIKDNIEKCGEYVISKIPVSKTVVLTALFIVGTAKEEELDKMEVSEYSKPFVEKVLWNIYRR